MSEDEIKMLKNMGSLGYPVERIVFVMGIEDIDGFKERFSDPSSDERRAYEQGAALSEYLVDLKLLEMSMSGDLKAMGKLEGRKLKYKDIARKG